VASSLATTGMFVIVSVVSGLETVDTELIWKTEDGSSFVLSMFSRFKGYNPLFLKPLMADYTVVAFSQADS
jgi:hypothetical protein